MWLGKMRTENFDIFQQEIVLNFSLKNSLLKIKPERPAQRGVFA